MANTDKDYLGAVVLKKTAGSGALTLNTQITVPSTLLDPNNPDNFQYLATINSSGFIANAIQGKKTPAFALSTVWKTSWATANFFNSLLFPGAATSDTDTFSVGFYDPLAAAISRQYDGAKCVGVKVSNAAQGAIGVQMAFVAHGSTEDAGWSAATTFSAPSVDAGVMQTPDKIAWVSATDVEGWELNLVRAQGYKFTNDGTLYSSAIVSGMFTGSLNLAQRPLASSVPGSSATLKIGAVSNGVQFAMLLNRDLFKRPYLAGIGQAGRAFSLVDLASGGNPCVISAM